MLDELDDDALRGGAQLNSTLVITFDHCLILSLVRLLLLVVKFCVIKSSRPNPSNFSSKVNLLWPYYMVCTRGVARLNFKRRQILGSCDCRREDAPSD